MDNKLSTVDQHKVRHILSNALGRLNGRQEALRQLVEQVCTEAEAVGWVVGRPAEWQIHSAVAYDYHYYLRHEEFKVVVCIKDCQILVGLPDDFRYGDTTPNVMVVGVAYDPKGSAPLVSSTGLKDPSVLLAEAIADVIRQARKPRPEAST